MKRTTPLRAKSRYKPAELKRFHGWIAGRGCLVCQWRDPETGKVTVHHVRGYADKDGMVLKNDWFVVPLCPRHHFIQHGPRMSVEALGHQGFFRIHGIDLLAEAIRLADEWRAA
jgi:hypothetical protein